MQAQVIYNASHWPAHVTQCCDSTIGVGPTLQKCLSKNSLLRTDIVLHGQPNPYITEIFCENHEEVYDTSSAMDQYWEKM